MYISEHPNGCGEKLYETHFTAFSLEINHLHKTKRTTVVQNGSLYLEVEVGVLSPGYLVLIDVGVARFHGGCAVEWRIQAPGYLPILAVVKHLLQSNACNTAEQNLIKSMTIMHIFNTSIPMYGLWG